MFGVVVGFHVHLAVRSKLCGVHQNPCTHGVRLARQAVDRLDKPADVRRTCDRDQGNPAGVLRQFAVEVILVQPAFWRCQHMHDGMPRTPGQVVGVMFELGGDDDGIRRAGQTERELVDRLGGVFAKDHGVRAKIRADKAPDDLVSLVVGHRAQT